jgi:hypothetical protein
MSDARGTGGRDDEMQAAWTHRLDRQRIRRLARDRDRAALLSAARIWLAVVLAVVGLLCLGLVWLSAHMPYLPLGPAS